MKSGVEELSAAYQHIGQGVPSSSDSRAIHFATVVAAEGMIARCSSTSVCEARCRWKETTAEP